MTPNIYGIGPGAFNQVPTLVSQARDLLRSSFVQSGKDPKTVANEQCFTCVCLGKGAEGQRRRSYGPSLYRFREPLQVILSCR